MSRIYRSLEKAQDERKKKTDEEKFLKMIEEKAFFSREEPTPKLCMEETE